MKALLIWNNLWADRRVCFSHPLPGTSDIPVLRAQNCFPVSSHCCLTLLFLSSSSPVYLFTLKLASPCLVFPPLSLTFHFHFLSISSCLHCSDVSLVWFFFFVHSLFPLFFSPLILSLRLSSSYPPTSFPFFHLSSSLHFLPTARAFHE